MGEWIDLTQPITEDVATKPPGHPAPEFEDYATYERDGYNATRLRLVTHCGTHVDAPTHLLPTDGNRTIETVTADEMVTEGVVVDLSHREPGSAIMADDLRDALGPFDLSPGDMVLANTGMAPSATDLETYRHEYVYPSEAAAEYLVERDVGWFATDALGVDAPGATIEEHVVHRTLLSAGVLIVEGVDGLDALAPGRYDVICTPLPYAGRDGSQARLLVRPRS